MDIELLKAGCILMLIGMGTVYFFILIMIWAMNITASVIKYVNKIFPEEIPEEKNISRKNKNSDNEEIALAIACAVKERSGVC